MSFFGNSGNFGELYKKKDHIRFLNDYEEELVEDEKGRMHKRVVYIGPYIPVRNELKSLRLILSGVVVLTILLVAAVIKAMFLNHSSAWFPLVSISTAVVAFPCLYLIMGTLHLPYSGKPMQRDGYMHGMVRMFRSCGAILPITGVTLASEFVYRAIYADWIFLRDDIWFLLLLVGTIVAAVGIIILLRLVEVDEISLKEYT